MKREKKDKHFIKKPVYPGGTKALRAFITENLKYPKEALEARKEGTVRIRYDIDYKGNVFEVYILTGIGYGCDEEAERLVRMLKFEVEKNRKVKVVFHKDIQIHFRLPKEKPKPKAESKPPIITTVQYNYTQSPKKDNDSGYGYTIKYK